MATFDPTRLYSTLLNTGLQVKDNALYQVIHDLIAALATINKQTNTLAASSSTPATVTNIIQQQLTESSDFGVEEFQIINNSSVTNVVNNVSNVVQQLTEFSSDLSALDDFQISGPIGPPGPIVPYHIGINETFFVPLYKQALFAMNIDNEGTIEVEGFLIEVETSTTSQVTITTTGNIDDLDFSNADMIRMNNPSLSTIRGLKAGNPGQKVTIVSVGAGQVDLSHQDTGDGTASNRLINSATTSKSSLAAGYGTVMYEYDSTTARWKMITHDQGAYITPAFSAGDFTGRGAMTWTVDAGDVTIMQYHLRGKILDVQFALENTSIGGTPDITLFIAKAQFGNFTPNKNVTMLSTLIYDNGPGTTGYSTSKNSTQNIAIDRSDDANFQASVNSTSLYGTIAFEVN